MLNQNNIGIYKWAGKIVKTLALTVVLHGAIAMPLFANDEQKETTTPIKHVVVIFQENVSFDHYFATYPNAANPAGEPSFHPDKGTPSVNGIPSALMINNPNLAPPFRLDRSQAATCDQDHDYTAEQQAYHAGLLDQFVQVAVANPSGCDPKQVMAYFDGNTVTAIWNYAQHYAMNDNHFSTTFGPSTPGALNLVSGQTDGVDLTAGNMTGDLESGSVIGDPQPYYDDCSYRETVGMSNGNKNVGDLLNAKGVTWGFFQGGFRPTSYTSNGKAVCGAVHTGSDGHPKKDYIPHHESFQYYASTSNPHHLAPISPELIGTDKDRANHQYDLADFWDSVKAHNIPAVTFLKAPGYQDGHAGYSDPLAEQGYLVNTLNRLQTLPEWNDMLVIIAYDDSDGWYDHVMPPIVNQSHTASDALTGIGACGAAQPGAYQGRCGYGPRQPLLVISPYARENYVDHSVTDLTSILRFVEDNWNLGRIGDQSFDAIAGSIENMLDYKHGRNDKKLILDPATGQQIEE